VTCRYYNKSRCSKGNSCLYSHAPDLYSLRSHSESVHSLVLAVISQLSSRGRNVCLYFIHNNMCRFKGNQCNYSHSREDLQWDDEELAKQLAAKLTDRKKQLTAKKEEKRASRTRQYSPAIEPTKKSLPNKPPTIIGPLREVTIPAVPPPKTTPNKGTRHPNKNGPYAAGANLYPPRWDLPQTLDRVQLIRLGLLAWVSALHAPLNIS
jgi:RNA-binding, Nab2-type zinc finger